MSIRHAAQMSPEELSLLDAYQDGYRAGINTQAAGLNPYQITTPEYDEWERGRKTAVAAWLVNFSVSA